MLDPTHDLELSFGVPSQSLPDRPFARSALPSTLPSFIFPQLLRGCSGPSVLSDSLRPYGLQPVRLLCPWNSPGKNTGVGCHALLQGIFPTLGLNPGLLLCRWNLYHLSHQGSPVFKCGNILFSSSESSLGFPLPLTEQPEQTLRPTQ